MLGTIQLDHKQRFGTIEIYNISSEGTLPAELNRVMPQILIPQGIFFFCSIFSQGLG